MNWIACQDANRHRSKNSEDNLAFSAASREIDLRFRLGSSGDCQAPGVSSTVSSVS